MGMFMFGFLAAVPSQTLIPHEFTDLHLIPAVQRGIERHKTL